MPLTVEQLARLLAVHSPAAEDLYFKLLLLVDHGDTATSDRLRCASQWLRSRLGGPVPEGDDALPGIALACYRIV